MSLGRYAVYLRKAIEGGKPVFPEAFVLTDAELQEAKNRSSTVKLESLEYLKKDNGPWRWAGQYQNDPVDQDSVEFKTAWFHPIVFNEGLTNNLASARTILSLDPAFRLKQHNDFSGLVLSKTTKDNNVYLLEAKQIKVNPALLIDEVFRLYDIYKFSTLIVETAQAQLLMLDLLRDAMKKRNVFFMTEEVSPGSTDNKTARIRGLIPHYAAGRIHHVEGLIDLEAQLTEFPRNNHDDIIDALAWQIPFWKVPGSESVSVKKEVVGDWNWWKKQAHKKPLRMGQLFGDLPRRF